MGNSTSSRAKAASVKAEAAVGGKVSNKKQQSGAGGRKVPSSPFSKKNKEKSLPSSSEQRSSPAPPELSEEPVLVEADDDETYETESDEEYDSSEEEDEEFDEFLAERLRILADAAALKRTAEAFLHPERPVVTSDPTACARSYFDRASAPEQESAEEAEARAQILADAAALKEVAARYLHPELPVVTSDATATARCYFDRASAPFNAEEIVSTSAYATETAQEKPEEESLEDHMQKLQALAPASSVKTVPAAGPVASVPHSASEVNLFDLQDA